MVGNLVVAVTLASCCLVAGGTAEAASKKTYEGAWFDVRYPSNFHVRPGMRSEDTGYREGYFDSVFFASPDESVVFYVLSPLWTRRPTDIALRPNVEVLVATGTGTSTPEVADIFIRARWFTARARNGSYWRSWLLLEYSDHSIDWAFGIKYRDWKSYQRYRARYVSFKGSLIQYADGQ